MKINGIDLITYGARLTGRTLESSETLISNEWPEGVLSPFIGNPTFKFKNLKLIIEFKGSPTTTSSNKSKLLKELSKCVITDLGLGSNTLTGFVVSHTVSINNGKYEAVEYELRVIEEMPQVTASYSASPITVNNPGTGVTPVRMEVTPSASGTTIVTINGDIKITLNNMTAGVTRSIDATTGVFEGTVNKFGNSVIYDFPKLKAGSNTITVSPAPTNLKLIYKPRVI